MNICKTNQIITAGLRLPMKRNHCGVQGEQSAHPPNSANGQQ